VFAIGKLLGFSVAVARDHYKNSLSQLCFTSSVIIENLADVRRISMPGRAIS